MSEAMASRRGFAFILVIVPLKQLIIFNVTIIITVILPQPEFLVPSGTWCSTWGHL